MLRGYNFLSRFNCLNRRLHSVQTAFWNAAVSQSGVRCHLHFQNDFLQTWLQPFCESRCCRLSVLFSVSFFLTLFSPNGGFHCKKTKKRRRTELWRRWEGHKETGRDERRQKRRLKTRGRGEEKKEEIEGGGGEWRCFPSCLNFIMVFKFNERLRGRQEGDRR